MTALPDSLRLGAAHLSVADLDRSVGFYQDALGLREHRREDGVAALGAGGEDLLVLHEEPGARPGGPRRGPVPLRAAVPVARGARPRASSGSPRRGTPVDGASDHGVSEAIYLHDPDDHGIELYADRPRAAWPPPAGPEERVGMYTRALDVDDLIGDDRRRARPSRTPAPGCAWATSICTSATSTRRGRSTPTGSGSS